LAERFVGLKEVPGPLSNPTILSWLRLDQTWPQDDSVPFCSAGLNYWAWLLRLPRSKSLRARSWLNVGETITLDQATIGFDVVILRHKLTDPGDHVIDFPGHVGLYSGRANGKVAILGANQSDSVNVSQFDEALVLGVRRLA
jgi:uncharacterized protein (TIGR02594 family)